MLNKINAVNANDMGYPYLRALKTSKTAFEKQTTTKLMAMIK